MVCDSSLAPKASLDCTDTPGRRSRIFWPLVPGGSTCLSTVAMRCTWRVSPWPITETVSSVCALSAASVLAPVSAAVAAWALVAAESAIATAIVRCRVCMVVRCMGDGHRHTCAVHGHYANGT